MLTTQNKFLKVNRLQNLLNERHDESMKRLEGKMFNLSQKIKSLAHERGNCGTIELRNRTIPSAPSGNKQKNSGKEK